MKKYTTGEMLDRLGINDVAINQKGYRVGYDHKGDLVTWDKNEKKPTVSDGHKFTLYYAWVKDDEWEINYHFVDFEEAQLAHANEKKTVVYVHDEETQYRFVHGEYGHFTKLANDGIGLDEITKGKWIIEN